MFYVLELGMIFRKHRILINLNFIFIYSFVFDELERMKNDVGVLTETKEKGSWNEVIGQTSIYTAVLVKVREQKVECQ